MPEMQDINPTKDMFIWSGKEKKKGAVITCLCIHECH